MNTRTCGKTRRANENSARSSASYSTVGNHRASSTKTNTPRTCSTFLTRNWATTPQIEMCRKTTPRPPLDLITQSSVVRQPNSFVGHGDGLLARQARGVIVVQLAKEGIVVSFSEISNFEFFFKSKNRKCVNALPRIHRAGQLLTPVGCPKLDNRKGGPRVLLR
jgi:hypothetical protein